MKLQVFACHRRLMKTDVDAGGVSACILSVIQEIVEGEEEIVVALDSDAHPNVTYLIWRRR